MNIYGKISPGCVEMLRKAFGIPRIRGQPQNSTLKNTPFNLNLEDYTMKTVLKFLLDQILKVLNYVLDRLNGALGLFGMEPITRGQIVTTVAKEMGKQSISKGIDYIFGLVKKLNPRSLMATLKKRLSPSKANTLVLDM